MKKPQRPSAARFYSQAILLMFVLGLAPVLLNIIVDPYELNTIVDLGLEKQKISEKAHYPLWKVIHFPKGQTDIVILGDSRARALRDKYWHEVGLSGAYNFAYGGATLHEIYDTFHYVKEQTDLKALIIGMQLRSFDPNYKNGMNRVPEALRLSSNPLEYYSNWFVSRISAKNLQQKFQTELSWLEAGNFNFVSTAIAKHTPDAHPQATHQPPPQGAPPQGECHDCKVPSIVPPANQKALAVPADHYFGNDLGIWSALWQPVPTVRSLPKKFARQVEVNAAATWRDFEFSYLFWEYLVEISAWCAQNDVALIFFVPPTIVEMQGRISEFGFGDLNHQFLADLARLGTVVDFDFNTPLTRDIDRFTDAYHFNSKAARLIVGEIAQLVSPDQQTRAKALKRRKDVVCPISSTEIITRTQDKALQVLEGRSCRIWRRNYE